jgi:outer membrane protein assembly factor BamB
MSTASIRVGLCFAMVWALAAGRAGAGGIVGAEPDWTYEPKGGLVGHPVPIKAIDAAEGVLVATGAGRVAVIDPSGRCRAEMSLDLPPSAPAVSGPLWGKDATGIVAVDTWGSVYAFDETGKRRWKYARTSSAGGFRLPVLADLNRDGKPEILTSDARGALIALNSEGRPVLEVQATNYRLSPPAVGDVDADGVVDLVFGTEDKEIHCVDSNGDLKWSTRVEGRFGRSLPLIADVDQDGRYEVYVSSSYNQAKPGLYCLDAATGALKWKAESNLQAYDSTAVADLDGDGKPEILFGDKNTRLYCLDASGKQKWSTQLGGKGIFFAPAVADLKGRGEATIFSVVRATGPEGYGLYLLDPRGKVLEGVALPGGGASSPTACRFKGSSDIHLLSNSGAGKLLCYRLAQDPGHARVLWASLRNNCEQTGLLPSRVAPPKHKPGGKYRSGFVSSVKAVTGTNLIRLAKTGDEIQAIRVVAPDTLIRTELIRAEPAASEVVGRFVTLQPGEYQVEVRGPRPVLFGNPHDNIVFAPDETRYTLSRDFEADEAEFARFEKNMAKWDDECATYAVVSARADLEFAKRRKVPELFDEARARRESLAALADRLAKTPRHGIALIDTIHNPWDNFDPAAHFRREPATPSVKVSMLGNEYESAAIALTNLQPRAATFRLIFRRPAGFILPAAWRLAARS